MKLYDWWKIDNCDCYDCFDNDFDNCVTISRIDESEEIAQSDYDIFVIALTKKVDFIQKVDDCIIVCDWSKLICDNFEKFKAFTAKEWSRDYHNKDDFIYQWIKELHLYVAGYVPDSFYSTLCKFVAELQ